MRNTVSLLLLVGIDYFQIILRLLRPNLLALFPVNELKINRKQSVVIDNLVFQYIFTLLIGITGNEREEKQNHEK